MKHLLSPSLSLLLAFVWVGCGSSPDDPNRKRIGSTTGSAHVENREAGYYDDDRQPSASWEAPDFDSLSDYNYVLTEQERRILRERAIEAGDEPDDYLQYLSEDEKANLRQRAENLADS